MGPASVFRFIELSNFRAAPVLNTIQSLLFSLPYSAPKGPALILSKSQYCFYGYIICCIVLFVNKYYMKI